MLMVIFGADASYDSIPSYPPSPTSLNPRDEYRPPLANQLFENRPFFAQILERYPKCLPIVPRLRAPKEAAIERELELLRTEADSYPARHCQLAAVRYYLHDMLCQSVDRWRGESRGVTNYKSLLDEIERWRMPRRESVCLVTFNYDMLLEDALPVVGLTIRGLPDYVDSHPHYRVVKLHGSVNWARELNARHEDLNRPSTSLVDVLIDKVAELDISHTYVQTSVHPATYVEGKIIFPAIAIPLERKSEFECPPSHLEKLIDILPEVRKLLVIGWRAAEQHFLSVLQDGLRSPLDVMVVAGSRGGAEGVRVVLARAIKTRLNDARFRELGDGFTQFVLNRGAREFIEG